MIRTALVVALGALFLAGCGSTCNSDNCGGCCDTNGVCQSASAGHCGLGGAACSTCVGLQACVLGACQLPGTNAGNGNGNGPSSGGPTGAGSSGASSGATGGQSSGSSGSSTSTDSTGSSGTTSSTASSSSTTGTTGTTTSSTTTNGSSASSTTGTTSSSTTSSTTVTTGTTTTSSTTTTGTTGTTGTTSTSTTGTTGTTTTGTTGSSAGGCSGYTNLAQLTGPGTQQEVFGNTDGAPSYTSSLCTDPFLGGGETGPTDSYTFTVNQPVILNASTQSLDGGSMDLSLTQGCGASEAEDECSSGLFIGLASVGPQKLTPGVYNLRVTGVNSFFVSTGSGEYDLSVSLGQPVSNDDCSGVEFLTLSGGTASVTVDTTNAVDDTVTSASGACAEDDGTGTGTLVGRGNGPDVVYAVQLSSPAPNGLHATLTPVNGSTASPVVSIRSSPCINNFADAGSTSARELGCGFAADGGPAPAVAATSSLSSGTYYIWVDSLGGTWGEMQLDVSAN